MSITYDTKGHARVLTGEDVRGFQMVALRGALSLEADGLRMSRYGSALKMVKLLTGLKARTASNMIPKFNQWLIDNHIMLIDSTGQYHYIPSAERENAK